MTQPALAKSGRGIKGGRTYAWPPPGTKNTSPPFEVSSVTTIIGAGLPKPALMYWAAKMVAEKAVESHAFVGSMIESQGKEETTKWLKGAHRTYTNKKADMGTIAHMAIEAYLDGRPLTDEALDEELKERKVPLDMWRTTKAYVSGAMEFFDQLEPEVLHSEVTVYSRKHGYAGTTDIIANMRLGGQGTVPCIIDFKTGKGVYPEMGLQLCAYAFADFIGRADGTEEPLPEGIRNGVIVRLTPGGGFEAVAFSLSPELLDVFLAVKGVAEGQAVMDEAKRPSL